MQSNFYSTLNLFKSPAKGKNIIKHGAKCHTTTPHTALDGFKRLFFDLNKFTHTHTHAHTSSLPIQAHCPARDAEKPDKNLNAEN